jgi:phosphate starvation-inducible membrane PsiE
MVVVSLKPTYELTKTVFASDKEQKKYGVGESLYKCGFLLHIVVFALLAAIPFFFIEEYSR